MVQSTQHLRVSISMRNSSAQESNPAVEIVKVKRNVTKSYCSKDHRTECSEPGTWFYCTEQIQAEHGSLWGHRCGPNLANGCAHKNLRYANSTMFDFDLPQDVLPSINIQTPTAIPFLRDRGFETPRLCNPLATWQGKIQRLQMIRSKSHWSTGG